MQLIGYFTCNLIGRDFVVGDIHGHYNLLMQTLKEVGFDFAKDRLFSVGDLIDRGSQSKEVVELLDKRWFFTVRGNHEQMLLDQFTQERVIFRDKQLLTPEETHIQSDGQWFVELPTEQKRWFFNKLQELPYLIEIDTEFGRVGICHAGIPDGIDDWHSLKAKIAGREIRESIMRNRSVKSQQTAITGIAMSVHGHTGFSTIRRVANSFWIDTLKKSGKLSVVELNRLSVLHD